MQCEICGQEITFMDTNTIKVGSKQYKCCNTCREIFDGRTPLDRDKATAHVYGHLDLINICANSNPEMKEIVQAIIETEEQRKAKEEEEKRKQQEIQQNKLDNKNTKLLRWRYCPFNYEKPNYDTFRTQVEDDIDYWIKRGWSVVNFERFIWYWGGVEGSKSKDRSINYECLMVRNKPRGVIEE